METSKQNIVEHYYDKYAESTAQLEIAKRTLEAIRIEQIEDDSAELEKVSDELWDDIHRLIESKVQAHDFLISQSGYAPWELEELEMEILESFDEPTTEV